MVKLEIYEDEEEIYYGTESKETDEKLLNDPYSDISLYKEYEEITGDSAIYTRGDNEYEYKAFQDWKNKYLSEIEDAVKKNTIPKVGLSKDALKESKIIALQQKAMGTAAKIMGIQYSELKDLILDLMSTYHIESENIALVVFAESHPNITESVKQNLGKKLYNNALSIINLDKKQYPTLFPSSSEKNEKIATQLEKKTKKSSKTDITNAKKSNNVYVALKWLTTFMDKMELICPHCGELFYKPTDKDIKKLEKINEMIKGL